MKDLVASNCQISIARLRDNISGIFEKYLAKFRRRANDDWSPMTFMVAARDIELDEEDNALIARVALPGLDRGDVKVEATAHRLVIRASKERSRKHKSGGYSTYEQSAASFAEAISLPCEIDRNRIKAKLKNGLLTVTLPKGESAKSERNKIPVNG